MKLPFRFPRGRRFFIFLILILLCAWPPGGRITAEPPAVPDTDPPAEDGVSEDEADSVNDPPVNTIPGPQVTPRNIPLTFSALNGNALIVSDPDLNGGNLRVTLSVSRGTLTVEEDSGALVEMNGTDTITITGSQGAVNVELEGLRYDPPPDWHGQVTLMMESNDLGNTGTPGPLTDQDSVEITVAVTVGPNQPPVADAGADLTVEEYRQVILDGSNSSDPDGPENRPVDYEWTQTAGPAVDLEGADRPVATFFAPEVGAGGDRLSFSLTVVDSRDAADTDEVAVTVLDIGEPIGTFPEGSTVFLNSPGFEEEAVSYAWNQISGPSVALSDEQAQQPSFVAPIVDPEGAVLVFQLTVENGDGGDISETFSVRVEDNGITGFPPDVLTFTPILTAEMGIAVDGGRLVRLRGLDPAEIQETMNRPQSLIYGLTEAAVKTEEPGAGASITFYLSDPAEEGFSWFGYTEDDRWFDFGSDAVFNPDRTRIALMVADGGMADRDAEINGIIRVLSGPGKAGTPTPPGSDGGSGDNGGCFIDIASP